MSTIQNGIIDLTAYIDKMKNFTDKSPFTIDIYSKAIRNCDVTTIDMGNIPAVWVHLLERLRSGKSSFGFVSTAIKVIRSALNFEGVGWTRDGNYHSLLLELNKRKKTKDGYSDEEIRQILLKTEGDDPELWRICILMSLSGLRIGACKGLKFSDFRQMPNGVWVYMVNSKGRRYLAAISDYGKLMLDASNWRNDELIVSEPQGKSSFDELLRSRLKYLMLKKGMRDYLVGKSIFHSMRHWALTKMSITLHSEDVSLLAGHSAANSVAMKYYINPDKMKVPVEWDKKVSEAYFNCPLNTWRIAE